MRQNMRWKAVVSMAFAGLVLGVGACSLQTLDDVACETSAECRSAFGMGSQCLTDGFCTEPDTCATTAECERTFGMGSRCEAGEGYEGRACSLPTNVGCRNANDCGAYALGGTCMPDGSCTRPDAPLCGDDQVCIDEHGAGAWCDPNSKLCRRDNN